MFAIWREAVMLLSSLGVSVAEGPGRRLGSAVVQIPEKSGLPSGMRGARAVMSTLPSGFRGTPAVGYFSHCAAKGVATMTKVASAARRERNGYCIGLRIQQR